MILIYDDGSKIEVDMPLFVHILKEVSSMMVAYTVEKYGLSRNDKQTVRLTNRVLQATWTNREWLEKYINHIYDEAIRFHQENSERPE